MLPPVEDAVLKNNPEFAALYKTLTTVILNPDGSTKNDAGAKERVAVKEDVKETRLQAAKSHLLAQAIATTVLPPSSAAPAASAGPAADTKFGAAARRAARATATATRSAPQAKSSVGDLPPELLDLLVLLPPLLQAGGIATGTGSSPSTATPPLLSAEDLDLLLASPLLAEALPRHLPRLAALVADTLQTSARGVARVTRPATNPSFLHRAVPSLPADATALQQAVSEEREQLAASRQATMTTLLGVLDDQTAALAALVRSLEAKHGAVARSLTLRASAVAVEAQQAGHVEAPQALAAARRTVYPSPDAAEALRNYADHLRDSTVRLEEAVRERKGLLQEYGVAVGEAGGEAAGGSAGPAAREKEKAMREMARVYQEMGQQVAEAKGDLARLRKR